MQPPARSNEEAAILAKATTLFRNKGFSATSMEDISDAVGLLKGSLYHYFKSKEEVLYRIVKPPWEKSVAELEKVATSDLAPLEKLREAIRLNVNMIDSYLPEIAVSLQEGFKAAGNDMRQEILQLQLRYERLLDKIIAEGRASGQLRGDLDPRITCYAILGMCNWMHKWYRRGGRLSSREIADEYISLLTSGIALRPRPEALERGGLLPLEAALPPPVRKARRMRRSSVKSGKTPLSQSVGTMKENAKERMVR